MNDTVPDREPTLGKYRILESIGRGGFATVYKARHISLGSEVALKVMLRVLSEEESFVQRFQLEARQTARLDHPNIVRILDLDEDQGQIFIAMEYVRGRALRAILKERLLPLEQVVAIVKQVAEALDYAHSCGLVHRDVTPGNILVREDGVVKLADFGIVKAMTNTKLTQTGTTIGTPAYMSPEQTQGRTVTNRSDIYSLGVVAYEMLTGQVPFDGDTPFSVGVKHVNEAPPPPSAISPRAQEPVEAAVLKALAKKPEDRYEAARAFAEALATAVAHLQERDLVNAYEQAQQLLNARHYEEALVLLERLEATQPGYGDVAALIRQAQEGLGIAALYAQANEQLQAVRELASQIVVHDPTYPDTKGVLAVLEPRRVSPKPGNLRGVRLHNALFWAGITLTLCGYFSGWRRQPLYAAINTPREMWEHTRWLWAAQGLFSDWVPPQIWAPIVVSLLIMVLYFLRHKFGRWSRLLGITSAALLLLGNAAIWSVAPVLKLDKSNGFWMISAGMLSLLATMLILLRENGERPIFPQRSRQG